MGVILNIQIVKKEIEHIIDVEDDKLYFVLKFFQFEISEMDDINLTKQEQSSLLSKVLNRQIPYQTYVSFYRKYIEGKKRIRKKIDVIADDIYEDVENIKKEYSDSWVSEEMSRTGKSELEVYESH